MNWLHSPPQIHNDFSALGSMQGDVYVISDNALSALREIYLKLSYEDRTLGTFRRTIGFCENIGRDLIPILIFSKDQSIIDETIRCLVNLTVPTECLFSVDVVQRTETGRYTLDEINNLLMASKECFTDVRTIRAVIDFIKSALERDNKLTVAQCDSVNNCLLLLRNILHIPESPYHHCNGRFVSVQNQIIWNLFTQSIDKLLIHLMSCAQKAKWAVTIVQLIAALYKDQHISTLQELLHLWFDASLSDSSEDFESNTSAKKEGSGESTPMLTSDPTSDSSDNSQGNRRVDMDVDDSHKYQLGGTIEKVFQKVTEYQNTIIIKSRIDYKQHSDRIKRQHSITARTSKKESLVAGYRNRNMAGVSSPGGKATTISKGLLPSLNPLNNYLPLSPPSETVLKKQRTNRTQKPEYPYSLSETSDCGYGTQVENPESISTSSNEEDPPTTQQKPSNNQKQRSNVAIKPKNIISLQEKDRRRKKLVKRGKSTLIKMKGLIHYLPSDEDISNILKEFTVDFLLKGYGCLVKELHAQLITQSDVIDIDTSHFFWLVTYFLKFAAQLELDLEHIKTVLCFDIVSYLTYEGGTLCEQFETSSRQQGIDLKPCLRRLHLVVTAIREFLQALSTYKKISHLSPDDINHIHLLQLQISSTANIKGLFVILLRSYNPILQSKQYLQDLIVTNHLLLLLIDEASDLKNFDVNSGMTKHIKQFATVEIMLHYGLLLEDFRDNSEFVNDCIFTMMHHIGGDVGEIGALYHPNILKTFLQIWESEYEICDDWTDLIEYVIHKLIKSPNQSPLILPKTASLDVDYLNLPCSDITIRKSSYNASINKDDMGNLTGNQSISDERFKHDMDNFNVNRDLNPKLSTYDQLELVSSMDVIEGDPPNYINRANIHDDEYEVSCWDTASMADSNLTRMYVSDEEENPNDFNEQVNMTENNQ